MKNKYFNNLITILLSLVIITRLYSKELYLEYDKLISYLSIIVLIITSFYFTIKLNFIQFNIIEIGKSIKNSKKDDLKALFMSLGGKIGVGSIAGVSLAIYKTGPGVLLWIWIISLISSILTYCENYLGIKYKHKNKGGVLYYIKKGLNNKYLSLLYTIILIFIYVIGFVGIQSNTIVKSITLVANINTNIIIILLLLIVSLIIFTNLNNIINFMSKLVPIMCILYLVLGFFIITNSNISLLETFKLILTDSLNIDRGILATIILGLKRGIFATESGIGTSSITSSISHNTPRNQGLFQVLGVHFISLVVITITGLIVIIDSNNYIGSINGIEIVMSIFKDYYGFLGGISLTIIIILFAISTIISAYYYGLKSIEFLKNKLNKQDSLIFKILILVFIFLGGIISSTIIWNITDTLILFLLLINIYTIFKLRKEINV